MYIFKKTHLFVFIKNIHVSVRLLSFLPHWALRWWVGGWQHCSATCGSAGLRKRTVLCVRTVSREERVLHPVECKHLLKPKPVVACNRDVPCGQEWLVGSWEEASLFKEIRFSTGYLVNSLTSRLSSRFSPSLILLLFELMYCIVFVFFKCPVTCGGGIRSRTLSCALEPKEACDLSTKPRSRSLCGLQSCPNSSLNRRPGLPPVYRRIPPPKTHPTTGSPSWTPTSTTAAPTRTTAEITIAFISTTRSPYLPEPTAPEIINADDYKFNNVIRENEDDKRKVHSTKPSSAEKDKVISTVEEERLEDREEGSAPDVWMNTPGFDYVVEDRTKEHERIIDLDSFTKVTSGTSQTATPAPETHPFTITTTTHSPSLTSTETWAKTSHYLSNPHTKSNTSPNSHWMHRVPLTTPVYRNHAVLPKTVFQKKQTPATTARKASSTAAPPQPAVPVSKLKKSAVTVRKNSPTSRVKQPPAKSKGSPVKSPNLQPRSSKSGSTGGQSNLMAREPVSMNKSWVVGNWSEVGTDLV